MMFVCVATRLGFIKQLMFRYRDVRIGFLTFALGLTSVWKYEAHKFGLCEVPVDLPNASVVVIVVEPTTTADIGIEDAAGGCGSALEHRNTR